MTTPRPLRLHDPDTSDKPEILVGSDRFTYRADDQWVQRPAEYSWQEVSAVAVDSCDNVFVFNRGDHPVMVFDRDGKFLRSWGPGGFVRAHGITIGPDDAVYCADDLDHTVSKFTPDGTLIWKLGTSGQPSDTGATSIDYRTITHAGPPFYFPTNVALSPEGDFTWPMDTATPEFTSFPEMVCCCFPGASPDQVRDSFRFRTELRSIGMAPSMSLIEKTAGSSVLHPTENFVSERTNVVRPCQVAFDAAGNLYVAELGYRSGMWPGTFPPTPDATGGRISIFSPDGELLARWGGGDNPTAPGDFFAPHDIRIDSRGDVYVSEVVWSAGANRGHVSADCHTLQKFILQSS